MAGYSIRKISVGNRKELNKHFLLDTKKYTADPTLLYFNVEGNDLPYVVDYNDFFKDINDKIKNSLVTSMTYDNGKVHIETLEGNLTKNYTYDFNFNSFDLTLHDKHFDCLKTSIFKILSYYNETPSAIMTISKYVTTISDIIDGDNIPIIEDQNEIINILDFYDNNKDLFLNILVSKIVFFDDNNNIIDYNNATRDEIIDSLITDIITQMEAAMIIFIQQNDAIELYQNYLNNLFIPRRQTSYQIEQPQEEEIQEEQETIQEEEQIQQYIKPSKKEILEALLNNLKELSDKKVKKLIRKQKNGNN